MHHVVAELTAQLFGMKNFDIKPITHRNYPIILCYNKHITRKSKILSSKIKICFSNLWAYSLL